MNEQKKEFESWEKKFKELKFKNMRHFGREANTKMIFEKTVLPLLTEAREETLNTCLGIVRGYPLREWGGEVEVEGEIENIAKRIESLI